jgi:hypothetical protein
MDETALTLERWGTRFSNRATEASYLAWHTQMSLPFMRLGMYLSIGNWAIVAPIVIAAHEPGAFVLLAFVVFVVGPVATGILTVISRPSGQRVMAPLVAAANAISGFFAVGYTNWTVEADPTHHAIETPVIAAIIVNYFGFGIFRMRPLAAVIAVAPYMLLEAGWLAAHVHAARGSNLFVPFDFLFLASAFVTGLMLNLFFELTSRRAFKQERIIESQKVRIEAAEAALQRELSHQVAQRSRDLGAALARTEGLAVGTVDVGPGAKLDARYEIVRLLGEGGMGAVYEVKRITDGQSLALKLVSGPVSRASAQRFAREAEIGAQLRHPNLVPIVDVGLAANGAPFLVMELVRGASLEDSRSRFGDETWALPILRQVARGLAALHTAKVVHRDLKPGNVILTGDGPPIARIADFGISRLNEPAIDGSAPTAAKLTGTNAMLGTPIYMAPELGKGGVAASAADVFAFGIVAYEMLTGRIPFAMPPVILAAAGQEIPAPGPIAQSVVLRCMSPNPSLRPTAEELVELT